jgi:hypothetical protein
MRRRGDKMAVRVERPAVRRIWSEVGFSIHWRILSFFFFCKTCPRCRATPRVANHDAVLGAQLGLQLVTKLNGQVGELKCQVAKLLPAKMPPKPCQKNAQIRGPKYNAKNIKSRSAALPRVPPSHTAHARHTRSTRRRPPRGAGGTAAIDPSRDPAFLLQTTLVRKDAGGTSFFWSDVTLNSAAW